MRILEGEQRPTSGSIAVDGRPVAFDLGARGHAAGIRVIHQEPEIVPELSVAENIFVGDMQGARGGVRSTGATCRTREPPCSRGSGCERDAGAARRPARRSARRSGS